MLVSEEIGALQAMFICCLCLRWTRSVPEVPGRFQLRSYTIYVNR